MLLASCCGVAFVLWFVCFLCFFLVAVVCFLRDIFLFTAVSLRECPSFFLMWWWGFVVPEPSASMPTFFRRLFS
jgi:hypothetical protein